MDSLSSRPPAVSLGVPTVLPGLDEILYREAEERKHRQEMREREALRLGYLGFEEWISEFYDLFLADGRIRKLHIIE